MMGGTLENGNICRNKATTGAGHKAVVGSQSEVAAPGDTVLSRVDVSRSTEMAQRAMIWSLL